MYAEADKLRFRIKDKKQYDICIHNYIYIGECDDDIIFEDWKLYSYGYDAISHMTQLQTVSICLCAYIFGVYKVFGVLVCILRGLFVDEGTSETAQRACKIHSVLCRKCERTEILLASICVFLLFSLDFFFLFFRILRNQSL